LHAVTHGSIHICDDLVAKRTQVGKAGKTGKAGGSDAAEGDAPAKKKRRVSWGADQEREFVS